MWTAARGRRSGRAGLRRRPRPGEHDCSQTPRLIELRFTPIPPCCRVCTWLTVCDIPFEYQSVAPLYNRDRNCTACEVVDDAAPDATFACTGPHDSRVSRCFDRFYRKRGLGRGVNMTHYPDGSHDMCLPCSDMSSVASVDDCERCSGGRDADCIAGTCAAGYHTYAWSNNMCSPCPRGTYNSETGSISADACIDCAAGTYAATEGNAAAGDCLPCAQGKYGLERGATFASSCIPCETGSWLDSVGSDNATACKDCPAGTYASTPL